MNRAVRLLRSGLSRIHVSGITRAIASTATEGNVPLSKGQAANDVPQVVFDDFIPSKFVQSYHIQGIGEKSGTNLKTVTGAGHILRTDLPLKMGGTDAYPQPVELLLAALIGCTQATAIFVGRHMKPRILIDRLEFDIHACRDERGAMELPIEIKPTVFAGLQTVKGTIKIHVKKGLISQSQLETLASQTEARCPVASMMIASGCVMELSWLTTANDC